MAVTVAAALIAGGKSCRMGRDKCLLPCGSGFLWEHQLDLLRRLKPAELFVSCRSDQEYFADAGVPCVADAWPDAGPLGGIVSVMQAMRSSHLLALAVDLPHMRLAALRDLVGACSAGVGAVFRRGGLWEPLAAVYPAGLIVAGRECLARGDFSLQNFIRGAIDGTNLRSLPLPEKWETCFANWNSPEDRPPETEKRNR